jgi:hypothetical protein
MYGIVGILLLVLDVYVLYLVLTSSIDVGLKLLWTILVLLLPLIGPILFFVLGPNPRRA